MTLKNAKNYSIVGISSDNSRIIVNDISDNYEYNNNKSYNNSGNDKNNNDKNNDISDNDRNNNKKKNNISDNDKNNNNNGNYHISRNSQ